MPRIDDLTFIKRTNTVCIDLRDAHPGGRISEDEWVDFLIDHVLKPEDLVEANIHSITGKLMVKLRNEETYQAVLGKLEQGIIWSKYDKPVYGWSLEDALTTVRIINVSLHIDIEKIKGKMAEYGKVVSCKKGTLKKIPTAFNNTLVLKMKLNEGAVLPSFIDVLSMGECLQIFTETQPKVCFRCTRVGHIAAYCRFRAKDVVFTSTQSSWAQIASGEEHEGGNMPGVSQLTQVLNDNDSMETEVEEAGSVPQASGEFQSGSLSSKEDSLPLGQGAYETSNGQESPESQQDGKSTTQLRGHVSPEESESLWEVSQDLRQRSDSLESINATVNKKPRVSHVSGKKR